MPVLRRFGQFVIRMYFRDENPPHVHVVGKEFEARVAIEGATILAGAMPARVRKQALAWIAANKEALLCEWEEKQG
ncbi:MAG TPA: DUF4160 domain-containing protein [Rhizomicrobium sp.]|jgi:hypothetical protein|nr:DUF4160 domain-containing protein [Rhizomicrobium sp.]